MQRPAGPTTAPKAATGATTATSSDSDFPPASAAGVFYYKTVARVGNRLVSIYDGKTEYSLGITLKHPEVILNPKATMPPGYYLCTTPEDALNCAIPTSAALFVAPRIIIKCLAWGQVEWPPASSAGAGAGAGAGAARRLPARTVAMRFVRPLEVIPIPLGAKNHVFSQRELLAVKLKHARALAPPLTAATGRNARPHLRSEADHKALTRNLTALERELTAAARAEVCDAPVSAGMTHLANRAMLSGVRRYITVHTADHSVLVPPREEGDDSAGGSDGAGGAGGAATAAYICDEYGRAVKLE